jgi:hypothetical protein
MKDIYLLSHGRADKPIENMSEIADYWAEIRTGTSLTQACNVTATPAYLVDLRTKLQVAIMTQPSLIHTDTEFA